MASASAKVAAGQLKALADGRFGPRSDYRSTPRFSWAGQKEGAAWVEYKWGQPRELSRSAVYWAVDRRQQAYWGPRIRNEDIALPGSWRLLYRDGEQWRPVELRKEDTFALRLDFPDEVRFKPVKTTAIRLEVVPVGVPCAIQEWRVD